MVAGTSMPIHSSRLRLALQGRCVAKLKTTDLVGIKWYLFEPSLQMNIANLKFRSLNVSLTSSRIFDRSGARV